MGCRAVCTCIHTSDYSAFHLPKTAYLLFTSAGSKCSCHSPLPKRSRMRAGKSSLSRPFVGDGDGPISLALLALLIELWDDVDILAPARASRTTLDSAAEAETGPGSLSCRYNVGTGTMDEASIPAADADRGTGGSGDCRPTDPAVRALSDGCISGETRAATGADGLIGVANTLRISSATVSSLFAGNS